MKSQEISTLVIEAFRDAGYEPRSYSGRAMYGRSCVGVTIERDQNELDLVLDTIEYYDGELRDILQALRGSRSDSMGLGTIVYWPDLPWVKEEEEVEEDDHDAVCGPGCDCEKGVN